MKKQVAMTLGAILVMGSLVAKANDAVVLNSYNRLEASCGVKFQAQSQAIVIGEIRAKVRDIRDTEYQNDLNSLTEKFEKNFADKSELNGQQGIYSYLSPTTHSSIRKNSALERARDTVGGALVKNFTIWGGFLDKAPTADKTTEQTQLALPVVFLPNTTKAQLAQRMCQDLTACQQEIVSIGLNDYAKQQQLQF